MQTVVTTLVVACLLAAGCAKPAAEQAPSDATGRAAEKRSLIPARRAPIADVGEWSGAVMATSRTEIRTSQAIRIKSIPVQVLQAVHRGDLLIEVDRSEMEKKVTDLKDKLATMEIDMRSADVTLEAKMRLLKRRRILSESGAIAQKDLEEAEKDAKLELNSHQSKVLELEKVKREVAEAQTGLESANIYSPMDGIVSNLPDLTASHDVPAAAMIAVVSDPNQLSLWVSVDETQRSRLSVGMAAEVALDAFPGKMLKGTVQEVGLSAEGGASFSPVKTYRCRVDFSAASPEVREGFRGTVKVMFSSVESAVTVPLAALRQLGEETQVLLVERKGQKARMQAVKVGIKTADEAEIKAGVEDGQYVVIDL